MPYRNKIYVAFDGDNDMKYYTMLKAWNSNENMNFSFNDAHDLQQSRDSSLTESIKHSLRFRMENSKIFILLIGQHTKYLTRFVEWEIKLAIRLQIPIIAVNLNKCPRWDDREPSSLKNELAIVVPFDMKDIKYAIDHWPEDHYRYLKSDNIQNFIYKS